MPNTIVSAIELMGEGTRELHWHVMQGRSYQRKFRVLTNGQFMGPAMVINQFGTLYGDLYTPSYNAAEADPFAYVQSLDVEPDGEDGIGWIITVGYGWYDPNNAGGGPAQNPLLMPIDVSWDFRDHETVLDVDQSGNAVLNTAGDPYDPPIVIDDPRLVLTVVRNEATFNVGWALTYRNAVNSDPFAGFPPLCCKVLNISSKNQWHQDQGWYSQTNYQFEFISPQVDYDSQYGFRKRIISQGYRAISVVTGKPYHVTFKGVPVNSPVLLDKNGYLLTSSQQPYFQTFQAYPELPFEAFGFDQNALMGQRTGRGA